MITQLKARQWASYLPVLLDEAEAVLRSHMARANKQWPRFDPDHEVLCIFHGPHVYVSPSWGKQQHTGPTRNDAAVHVYGFPSMIAEPTEDRAGTIHGLVVQIICAAKY